MEEDYPHTPQELERHFGAEKAWLDHLLDLRWPGRFRYPRCETSKVLSQQSRRVQCAGCGHQVSVTAGTVPQDTRTTLTV
jgi:hypothetical protein